MDFPFVMSSKILIQNGPEVKISKSYIIINKVVHNNYAQINYCVVLIYLEKYFTFRGQLLKLERANVNDNVVCSFIN